MKDTWYPKTKDWSEYPVGTKAQQSWSGSIWTKTKLGWKANGGDTFPYPGSANQVNIKL
jgi:hypothetical protein